MPKGKSQSLKRQPKQGTQKYEPLTGVGSIIEEHLFDKVSAEHKGIRKYYQKSFLGSGAFARVFEIEQHKTGELFAAKVVDKSNLEKHTAQKKLLREIELHLHLNDHANLVQFERFFEDEQNVYILMHLCKN